MYPPPACLNPSPARPHDARAGARLHRDAVVLAHAALALGAVEPTPLLLLPLLRVHLASLLCEAILGVVLLLARGGTAPHACERRKGARSGSRRSASVQRCTWRAPLRVASRAHRPPSRR